MMQGEVTLDMDNSDLFLRNGKQKAAKAPVHQSSVSEHFKEGFPLFLNRWSEGFELRAHSHDYIEIVYVTSGEGYHYIGDRVEKTGKGCLYHLPVGTSHILRPASTSARNPLIVYNLCVLPEFAAELGAWMGNYGSGGEPLFIFTGEPGSYIAVEDRGLELGEAFESMYREYTGQPWGFEASLFAGLLKLSVRIARLVKQQTEELKETGHSPQVNSGEWSELLQYISLHIAEPLTLSQLAAEAGISNRHFIRLFRQQAGMSFSDYLQHKRIGLACHLLIETGRKMPDIAKSIGYQDTAHFREIFRKLMGVSPSEYRKAPGISGPISHTEQQQ
ncbi:AraC family transcriptional regulator [Paenibacillus sp. FSL R7-0273]|uniref:AraC family transcriptional regulator n=1 Tax=Paenibacillus sp. FSL R7-0273 TaxID=1536772 RepID=UPI000ADBA5A1|nr:AraC family transcriptional regulator [Paenibacillus sp. FSL R7-0273]